MGQVNSDSSLCKWHLNAGKQLTNKEATARLVLTDPLRLVSMLWVSLGFNLLPNDQKHRSTCASSVLTLERKGREQIRVVGSGVGTWLGPG